MTLLYVTANPKPVHESYGLQLGKYFLDTYTSLKPEEPVERLDLIHADPPPLEKDALALWEQKGQRQEEDSLTNPYVDQFLNADKLVLVTPLWNMSFPPQVKAYIDHLIFPGKTFRFSDKGIEGLMQSKTVIHVQSRGGIYSEGPLQKFEHGDSYLRTILGLIGVKNYYHLFIEGTSTYADELSERMAAAEQRAAELAERIAGV